MHTPHAFIEGVGLKEDGDRSSGTLMAIIDSVGRKAGLSEQSTCILQSLRLTWIDINSTACESQR